ncbi:fumarylacetoacetate hydrolase family protein [Microbacterium sp. SORGH_AS_0888]|uniref:fumarylacetoacetate hydrolase family protein n=1 Tax=Microbacterium sp. SORGH_AS_0888 TaxID=3041791 RepID=UPI00277D43DB|nr:fumarylacetoacetate hydrolase family protein [Microbacterium sp. SORGH_AS_0888]MDQ1128719.1 acylpyruvate hydrolase [Microbacterium sp. SORGH_AS_0888]
MRLATVRLPDGGTRAAAADGDDWRLLSAPTLDAAIAAGDLSAQAAAARRTGERAAAADVTLLRPLLSPRKIVCCGLNYRDHIAETGRETPRHPTLFAKFADTLTDPGAEIAVSGSSAVDWEAELAVVVGADVTRATVADARAAILGYTIANDVSMRDWQSRTLQWMQGKVWDATTPLGPVVVTADEFDPADGARIETLIDAEVVQSSTVDQLLFGAAELVAYISRFLRLSPGDLVLTGTPSGVGLGRTPRRYLSDGEVLTTRIAGIGELRNPFRITEDGTVSA